MGISEKTRNDVRTNNIESEEFLIKDGLRQGGGLSPSFTSYNSRYNGIGESNIKKVQMGYINLAPLWRYQNVFMWMILYYAPKPYHME